MLWDSAFDPPTQSVTKSMYITVTLIIGVDDILTENKQLNTEM